MNKMLERLFTESDKYNVHKLLGLYCILNYIRVLVFQGDISTASLVPHILLHVSSFIFHVLEQRRTDSKLNFFIWEEMRLHSFAFSLRAILCMIFPYARVWICFGIMAAADIISHFYGNPNNRTVRGDVTRESSIKLQVIQSAYAMSQFGATAGCMGLFLTEGFEFNPRFAFSTLPAIQLSAFFMTLYRKRLIGVKAWGLGYNICLSASYIVWLQLYGWHYPFLEIFIMFVMRKMGLNKYVLWAAAVLYPFKPFSFSNLV
jgi:hypothetical protein